MAETEPANTAIYEDKQTAVQDEQDLVKLWCDQINRASDDEKEWRDEAEKASNAYKGKRTGGVKEFNIFHSNIETLVPAVYNSTPIPDVRRRFSDDDPAGKEVSDILERGLAFSTDTYDFDSLMTACTKDSAIVDRGVARVRYVPYITAQPDPNTGEMVESVTYEEGRCEHVPWRDFRRGPGRFWAEVPWIAFRHYLSKDEIRKLIEGRGIDIEQVQMNYNAGGTEEAEKNKSPKLDVFKRGMVWEIWDKDNKQVLFICPDYKERALKIESDALELEGFFPIPRPMQQIEQSDSLVPITPLSIYVDLVEELNEVTRRITKLVKQLRPRFGYAASVPDMKAITEADDGEGIPLTNVEMFAQGKGIDGALTWFPLDTITKALVALYQQRDTIKQTIYEVTGIADILRGSTDANETATAQKIKAQWGSLRIQRMQGEVARFARDLFRLKAEIIATKFQWQTIVMMTGIQLPTQEEKQAAQAMLQRVQQSGIQVPPEMQGQLQQAQAILAKPSKEEVEQLLKNDAMRNYRVDIESDSTIRADLMRNQETMSTFLQGTAQYLAAVGPAVQEGYMPPDAAVDVYVAFARQFKLGKQAEDALERLSEGSRQSAKQERPDPEMEKLKLQRENDQAKMKLEQEKMAAERQDAQMRLKLDADDMEARRAMEEKKIDQELQLRREKNAADSAAKRDAAKQKAKSAPAGTNGKSASVSIDTSDLSEVMEQNATLMVSAVQALTQSAQVLAAAAKMMAAPKRIVRDPATGQAAGVEPVAMQ